MRVGSRLASLALLLLAACTEQGPSVLIHKANGGEIAVQVEIADDDAERARGLMYRTELAPQDGMLFLFPDEQPRSFWMKNTPLPLDIVYVSSDGKIVSIAKRTKPFSLDSIPSGAPAESVLEVNAGFADEHGVAVGDRIEVRGMP